MTATSVEDCDEIAALVQEHSAYERGTTTMPRDWSSRIARLIAVGRITAFVATTGRTAVGFCSTTTDVSTWSAESYIHLDCLYVTEAYRGAGVGRLLVDAVVEQATAAGVCEIQWQTPDWNHDAMRFYDRLGATAQAKARFTLALSTENTLRSRTPQSSAEQPSH